MTKAEGKALLKKHVALKRKIAALRRQLAAQAKQMAERQTVLQAIGRKL